MKLKEAYAEGEEALEDIRVQLPPTYQHIMKYRRDIQKEHGFDCRYHSFPKDFSI